MLRCSPEAFAKCQTRHICGNIQEATFTEGSECDLFNQSVVSKPMANGERIRAMDETKLVRFLDDVTWSALDSGGDLSKCKYPTDTLGWREWLKQPAKEVIP